MSKQATLLWKDPKMRGWQYKTAYSWQLVYLPSKRTMRYQCVWGTFSYCKLRELKDSGRMYKRELISEFQKVNSSIHLFYRHVLFLNTDHIIFSRDHIFHKNRSFRVVVSTRTAAKFTNSQKRSCKVCKITVSSLLNVQICDFLPGGGGVMVC